MTAIVVENLVKTYRNQVKRSGLGGALRDLYSPEYNEVRAVDGISLKINEGECVGYIGPNGAGKSTSIKMLTGILQATSGDIKINGLNPFLDRKTYTRSIGVVFGQRTQLWWDIAVRESFELLRRIYSVPVEQFNREVGRLIELFGVGDLLSTPVRKLSLGERMKCDLIASLIHSPKILFLDEPTIGLDAVAKESIRAVLKVLKAESKTTILLTTHDLPEIEELCERIMVIDKGKIVFDGALKEIINKYGAYRNLTLELDTSNNNFDFLMSNDGVKNIDLKPGILSVEFDRRLISVPSLLDKVEKIVSIKDLSIKEPSIEQIITKMYKDQDGRILG
jgi:ABC-2 type transport system ATP-binding protein